MPQWKPAGFIDDTIKPKTVVSGVPVIGGLDIIKTFGEDASVILALGDPISKKKLLDQMNNNNIQFPNIIHPSAIIQAPHEIQMGKGCVIGAGSILTTDIRIGDHVLINLNSTVGHDVSIGHFSSVMPGVNIAGEVTIGSCVLIGSGANILNGVTVADSCIVGMGSVVIRDVQTGTKVAGVPAREIKK
jgi:sugar O-acyltransferase (sialic acid O-acetyltransferase NeuD family)